MISRPRRSIRRRRTAAAIRQEGSIVGTLAYLSSEQCRGEGASAASDLHALGCVMFQLLTGELDIAGVFNWT